VKILAEKTMDNKHNMMKIAKLGYYNMVSLVSSS
jgi:hypothetical protein